MTVTVAPLLWAFLAFALGGLLKGATGAGAPIVAVPLLAMFYDVPTAVAVFAVPSLASNALQLWRFRRDLPKNAFATVFAIAGGSGAALGTVMLARLSSEVLVLLVAVAVWLYVGFRLARPDWLLSERAGRLLVAPAGLLGGLLQGSSGLSAPISLTFLSSLRLERRTFIVTISAYFTAISAVQLPLLWRFDILTPQLLAWSCLALLPLLGGMPVGAWLARHLSARLFERLILVLLLGVSIRLAAAALF